MKVLFKMICVLVALGASTVFAQADRGNRDTVALEMTVTGSGASRQVKVEVWHYVDADTLSGATTGFQWEPADMNLDSAAFSAEAIAAWDFTKSLYFGNDIAQSNTQNKCIYAGARLTSAAGFKAAAARRLVATYWFTLPTTSGVQTTLNLTFDTNAYNGGALYKFVRVGNTANMLPHYTGKLIQANPLDADENGNNLPTSFALDQNYPNPFNPKTTINFALPEKSNVTLRVYNVLGQSINDLVNQEMPAGSYTVEWDGRDGSGRAVASGVYFYRLETKGFTQTKKMMLLK